MDSIEEFNSNLLNDIAADAEYGNILKAEALFINIANEILELGEISDEPQYSHESLQSSAGKPGWKIDGYLYDGSGVDSLDDLHLFIIDGNYNYEIENMNSNDLGRNFQNLFRFLESILEKNLKDELETSSEVYKLAEIIDRDWGKINRIKFYLLTNKKFTGRLENIPDAEINGKRIIHNIWDLNRLFQNDSQSVEKEDMVIDFDDYGGAIPVLSANIEGTNYQSYLTIMSGKQLVEIYDKWGERLLEKNVRVFLQATNKVNRGVRSTIINQPEMFFAFNNGLTITADSVNISENKILSMNNLQIVNGGQTTGSIFDANLKKYDISKIFIPIKLTVIRENSQEEYENIVSDISRFSNSQSAVKLDDFSSNDMFHRRIQEFSRKIAVPLLDGSTASIRTKWFYERARGQLKQGKYYEKNFDRIYPTKKPYSKKFQQKFTKTDLMKFLNVWECNPHEVSSGASYNFGKYYPKIKTKFEKNPNFYDIRFYEHTIAKIIIFKSTEIIVSDSDWYYIGTRAQIVAYTLSKIAYDAKNYTDKVFDFDKIWQKQDIDSNWENVLKIGSKYAKESIEDSAARLEKTFGQAAKQEVCWNSLKNKNIPWSENIEKLLISKDKDRKIKKENKAINKTYSNMEASSIVLEQGQDFWESIKNWMNENSHGTDKDKGILQSVINVYITAKMPSERQIKYALELAERLNDFGCPHKIKLTKNT